MTCVDHGIVYFLPYIFTISSLSIYKSSHAQGMDQCFARQS